MSQMLEKIMEKLAEGVSSQLEYGVGQMCLQDVYMVADIVKDMAEAEYYCAVTEAMESERYGYDGGTGGSGNSGRMGYRNRYGNFPANPRNRRGYMPTMGGGPRYGYSIDSLREEMKSADSQERQQMMQELQQMMREMG